MKFHLIKYQSKQGQVSDKNRLQNKLIQPLLAYTGCRQWQPSETAFRDQVHQVQQWQIARVTQTHKAILNDPVVAKAAHFLLIEAYQGQDLSQISNQIEKMVPYLVAWLPEQLMETIEQLLQLNLLTARLDEALAHEIFEIQSHNQLTEAIYTQAFLAVGGGQWRSQQLDMMSELSYLLEHHVKNAMLLRIFKWAKGPAYAANFKVLYDFLQSGLTAFKEVTSPSELINTVLAVEYAINHQMVTGVAV